MPSAYSEFERALFGFGGRRWAWFEPEQSSAYRARIAAWDTGPNYVVSAELPGLGEKDVQVALRDDVLTFSGERRLDAPEGYAASRRERFAAKFSRSIRLGVKVDAERVEAALKNGILTITLPKSAETATRQVPVKTSV